MAPLAIAGLSLAAAGLAALVVACRDCMRRRVPSLRYGARTVAGGRMRAVWLAVLVGGYAAGAFGVEVASRETVRREPGEVAAPAVPAAGGRHVLRIPFYVRESGREPGPGGSALLVSRESVTLPWSFLLALALYSVFAVGWPAAAPTVDRPR